MQPACNSANVVLEVTHNLDLTVDWNWKLKSSRGETISAGHIIAYSAREAGARIVDEVMRQLKLARGDVPLNADSPSRPKGGGTIAPRTLMVAFLPTDFNVQDTRLNLFVDSEQVSARDVHGNLIFQFQVKDFRDARLEREWEQPLQMNFPTGLITWTADASNHWFDPVTFRGTEMPFNHGVLFLSGALGVISYLSVGAVAAQVRTPWHRLELAWEEDDVVKTVALQVPGRGSKELVRDLQIASAAARPACAVTRTDIR